MVPQAVQLTIGAERPFRLEPELPCTLGAGSGCFSPFRRSHPVGLPRLAWTAIQLFLNPG